MTQELVERPLDYIEALGLLGEARREIERLREALTRITIEDGGFGSYHDVSDWRTSAFLRKIARAALQEKGK